MHHHLLPQSRHWKVHVVIASAPQEQIQKMTTHHALKNSLMPVTLRGLEKCRGLLQQVARDRCVQVLVLRAPCPLDGLMGRHRHRLCPLDTAWAPCLCEAELDG